MTINYPYPFCQMPYQNYYFPQNGLNSMYYPDSNQGQFQEQSYIENILRLNKGKIATIYMNFEGSQWGSKIFRGEIMAAGRDHIILKDVQSKTNYLLLTIYLSYITFEENIEYNYAFSQQPTS